jgi:hypothetical protein
MFNAVIVVNGKFVRVVSQYVDNVLNEYPNDFVDSVMKPSARNHPSSDTAY